MNTSTFTTLCFALFSAFISTSSHAATWVHGHTVKAAWIEQGNLLVETVSVQGPYACSLNTALFVIEPNEGDIKAGLSVALTALVSGKKVGFLIGANNTCPWGAHDASSVKLTAY